MEQFRYGLTNDIKDLLLTFPEEPKSWYVVVPYGARSLRESGGNRWGFGLGRGEF